MNTISEIGKQNQQDFWAWMFLYLGKNIMKYCGRGGEGAIRGAVRQMAVEKGRELGAFYIEAGIKPNLSTLYETPAECGQDPRFRREILAEDEEMRLWEVYTCPLAALWLDQSGEKLGKLYCEENQHGLIEGFTEGRGQLNLTKKLPCHRTNGCRADNHCRFSAYYRAANVDAEKRKESFTEKRTGGREQENQVTIRPYREDLKETCIRTICYVSKAAGERFGAEGNCAVAQGLKELAYKTAELLKFHAEATLNRCDQEFVRENLPVDLDQEKDPVWEKYDSCGAWELYMVNFQEPLKEQLSFN